MTLALSIMLSLSLPVSAFQIDTDSDLSLSNGSVVKLKKSTIQSTLANSDSLLPTNEANEADIRVDGISVDENSIVINGTYEHTPFTFNGDVYKSSLFDEDNLIYVCDLSENNDSLTANYCEITTSNSSTSITGIYEDNTDIFKLYFTDSEGNLVLYESDLDSLNINGINSISTTEATSAEIDTAWFTTVLDPIETSERTLDSFTDEEIAADEGLQEIFNQIYSTKTRSSNNYTWSGSVYTSTYKVGTETFVYRACPYFEGNIGDVPQYGTTQWTTALKLSESVTVDGTVANQYTNIYYLKNMHCEMGAGTNTELISRTLGGSYVRVVAGTVSVNFAGLLAKVINTSTGTTAASTILSWISTINYTSSSVENVNTGYATLADNTRVVGVSAESNAIINDASHQISVWPTAQTMSASGSANVSAPCVIRWSFDLYSSSGDGGLIKSFSGSSAQKTIYYIANAS